MSQKKASLGTAINSSFEKFSHIAMSTKDTNDDDLRSPSVELSISPMMMRQPVAKPPASQKKAAASDIFERTNRTQHGRRSYPVRTSLVRRKRPRLLWRP